MRTLTKKNYLLSEVKAQIKNSFKQWYVGTSEWDDVWRRFRAEMVVFNVLDKEATEAVYHQLVAEGMKGRKPIGAQPNYLYLYRADGMLPDGFIY